MQRNRFEKRTAVEYGFYLEYRLRAGQGGSVEESHSCLSCFDSLLTISKTEQTFFGLFCTYIGRI